MKCKHCGQMLPKNQRICPDCGKDSREDAVIVPVENWAATDRPSPVEKEAASPKGKKMMRTAITSGCVVALAALGLVLFFILRSGAADPNAVPGSYTVSEKKAVKKAKTVVATLDDRKLTNGELQIYYQFAITNFVNQNFNYLSNFGLDYTQPLDQQTCPLIEGYTWQQYFLEQAIEEWRGNNSLVLQAEKAGFQLDENYQKELDEMEPGLTEVAKNSGFDTVDDVVKYQCGANTSFAGYHSYMESYFIGSLYFEELHKQMEQPTDEDVEAYFLENREKLEASGIKQDGSYTVDVRHILVTIENIAKDVPAGEDEKLADGYTQAQWDACEAAAQEIMDLWLKNPTEDNFAALAGEKTQDPGSKDTGGLYTGVMAGQMVPAFNDWCFDEARQAGDFGMVKTNYGYHVMYFADRSEDLWMTQTRQRLMQEDARKLLDQVKENFAFEVSHDKIALVYVDLIK